MTSSGSGLAAESHETDDGALLATIEVGDTTGARHRFDERALAPGTMVGRHEVLERVGDGGHAVVYRAVDRQLDRPVALKLLTRDPGRGIDPDRRERMLREARAMAQLTHPNVVQVYDVGEHEDTVYIAMEFCSGTLRDWLIEGPHPWPAVLGRFIDAGRGLEAAHEAGIVHRDFKPANVLVGDDGRVRVADFGISVPTDTGVRTAHVSEIPEVPALSTVDADRLTETGMAMGTPAFMSPEQFRGTEVDARSDQFSFCVAVFRAIYDLAPFPGTGMRELRKTVCAGELVPVPSTAPGWVESALRRGLRVDPVDRWPSMTALLEHLEHRSGRGRPIWVLAGVGGLGVAAAVALFPQPDPCASAASELAETWSPARASDVAAALDARPAFVTQGWARAGDPLDRFAAEWTSARRDVCTGREAITDAVHDARVACLDHQRRTLDVTLQSLEREDLDEVTGGLGRLRALPDPGRCAVATGEGSADFPADPEIAARVGVLDETLGRIAALYEAGRYREARDLADPTLAAAEGIDYCPIQARAALELARLEEALSIDGATQRLERAYFDASTCGDRDTRTAAAIELIRATRNEVDGREPVEWGRQAMAELEAEKADDATVAKVLSAIADAASVRGDTKNALLRHREALALREGLEGDHALELAESHLGIGRQHLTHRDYADAKRHLEKALSLQRSALGPGHPTLASTFNALGVHANETGSNDEAIAFYQDALELVTQAFGEGHLRTAPMLQNLGNALITIDEARALRFMQEAVELRSQALGPDHPALTGIHIALGNVLVANERLDDAERTYHRAIDLVRNNGGDVAGFCGVELAQIHALRGDYPQALAKVDEMLALPPAAFVSDKQHAGVPAQLSRVLWLTGRYPERSRALTEESVRRFSAIGDLQEAERVAANFDEFSTGGRSP